MMPILGVEDKPQYSINGEHVALALIGPNGLRIPLSFPRQHLALFVSRLMRVHLTAESIASHSGGPAEMPAVEAEHASAQAPYGGALAVLTVVTKLPAIQHFELSPEQAENLAADLHQAAKEARKNSVQSRH